MMHNHPPMNGMVQNCDYCKKYGNIFHIVNGSSNIKIPLKAFEHKKK